METSDEAEVCHSSVKPDAYITEDSNHIEDASHEDAEVDKTSEIDKTSTIGGSGHKETEVLAVKTSDQTFCNVEVARSYTSINDALEASAGSKHFSDEVDEATGLDKLNISSNVAESFCLQHDGTEEKVKLVTSLDLECVDEDEVRPSDTDIKIGSSRKAVESDTETLKQNNLDNEEKFRMDASVNHEHIGDHWVTRNLKTFENLPFTNIDKLMLKSGCEESVFHELPDELTVKIFSYLTTKELCQNVVLVCRKWRQISLDHSLWKSLDFSTCPNMSSLNLLWVMRRAPLLKRLVLSGRVNITRAEVAIFSECCRCIQDIDFGFCTSLSGDMIQCLAENCPELMKINVEGCDNLQENCLKYLVKCKKLSHLNFSHCMFFQDSTVIYLANGLPMIKSINLDGISFLTDSAVIGLVTHHYLCLEEVELDGAEISDAGMQDLARCKQLKHLGISFCECLTDLSLDYLKDLNNLVNLRLRKGSDFTADGLSAFFKTASLSKLQVLNLSECSSINDTVMLDMSQACGSQLRELALSWCWFITDTGLISIMDHCCNLETLDLLGIDRIFGECLSRVPEEMKKLKFLDLRQCNKILDNLIVDMVRRKKDLKVFNYYGEEFVHD